MDFSDDRYGGSKDEEIDVCIVAGRRPELLQRTLDSFDKHLLKNFQVRNVIANIDPIFGSEEDRLKCVKIITNYDSGALITEPEEANFCRAVISNWSKSSAPVVLHLEDDWLLHDSVYPEHLRPFAAERSVKQIAFNHHYKDWDVSRRGQFHMARLERRFLGIKLPLKRSIPKFTTSPSFLRGEFARLCARLLDVRYDPEKQFTSGKNRRLTNAVAHHRVSLIGNAPGFFIQDIGREWRAVRSIEKNLVNGNSVWTEPSIQAS